MFVPNARPGALCKFDIMERTTRSTMYELRMKSLILNPPIEDEFCAIVHTPNPSQSKQKFLVASSAAGPGVMVLVEMLEEFFRLILFIKKTKEDAESAVEFRRRRHKSSRLGEQCCSNLYCWLFYKVHDLLNIASCRTIVELHFSDKYFINHDGKVIWFQK